jgi:predicted amidohydrolase YtcJ
MTVVTNPGFVHERGDTYLVDVDASERSDLYRCASLHRGGVKVIAGTDAPFGPADPWQAARVATTRKTANGAILGRDEALSSRAALSLFVDGADGRGCLPSIVPGAASDLIVLGVPLNEALESLSGDNVAACIVGGRVALDRR